MRKRIVGVGLLLALIGVVGVETQRGASSSSDHEPGGLQAPAPLPGKRSPRMPVAVAAVAGTAGSSEPSAGHLPVVPSSHVAVAPDQSQLQHALTLLPCASMRLAELRSELDWRVESLENVNKMLAGGNLDPERRAVFVRIRDELPVQIQEGRSTIANCEATPEAERDQGMALLQRAAEAGVPGARTAYARNALAEYADAPDVLANIDEVRRRRDLMQRFLAEAQAQCEPDVWSARFDLLNVAGLGSRDRAAQVAIIQAYYAVQLAHGEEAAHLQHVQDTLDAAANGLDAATRERALRQGEAEAARCAASFQGPP